RLPGLRGLGAPGASPLPSPERRLRDAGHDLRRAARARLRGATGAELALDGSSLHALPRGADQAGDGGAGGGRGVPRADGRPGRPVARAALRRGDAGRRAGAAPPAVVRRAPRLPRGGPASRLVGNPARDVAGRPGGGDGAAGPGGAAAAGPRGRAVAGRARGARELGPLTGRGRTAGGERGDVTGEGSVALRGAPGLNGGPVPGGP